MQRGSVRANRALRSPWRRRSSVFLLPLTRPASRAPLLAPRQPRPRRHLQPERDPRPPPHQPLRRPARLPVPVRGAEGGRRGQCVAPRPARLCRAQSPPSSPSDRSERRAPRDHGQDGHVGPQGLRQRRVRPYGPPHSRRLRGRSAARLPPRGVWTALHCVPPCADARGPAPDPGAAAGAPPAQQGHHRHPVRHHAGRPRHFFRRLHGQAAGRGLVRGAAHLQVGPARQHRRHLPAVSPRTHSRCCDMCGHALLTHPLAHSLFWAVARTRGP